MAKRSRGNQLGLFVTALALALAAGLALYLTRPRLAVLWAIGIGLGFVLQRSRFCFAASVRDLFLFRDTGPGRAVLLLLAVSTITFALVQHRIAEQGLPVPGYVLPVGFHTALGATMFGFGMVLASGCAGGTLVRMGEGFAWHWLAAVGLVTGSLAGAKSYDWVWKWLVNAPTVHLPQVLGWVGAVMAQLAIFAGLWQLFQYLDRPRTRQVSLAEHIDRKG